MWIRLAFHRGTEVVIVCEGVGRDPEIADPRVVGEHDVQRRGLVSGAGASIEDVSDGDGGDGPASEGLVEGGVEFGGPVTVEQLEQARGVAGQRFPAQGQGIDERVGLGATGAEEIAPAQLMGVTFLPGQGGEVSGILDRFSAIVAAGMASDLAGAVEDADEMFGSDQGQDPAHPVMRDGVVIAVEAHVGGLAGGDGAEVTQSKSCSA